MSDIVMKQESTLTNKTTPTMTDLLRLVGSDDHSYKALVSDVAKAIIETYAGSTLAGSAQSVKSALDALNSNLNGIRFTSFEVNASTSKTITLYANSRYLMMTTAYSSSVKGLYIVHVVGSGSVGGSCVGGSPSDLSVSYASKAMTITNNSSVGVIVFVITFEGTPPLA